LKQRGSGVEALTQEDEARYRALCGRIRAWHEEQDIRFDYPPATEEQVRATEAGLGVPLPPLLRMLYREAANGGNLLSEHDDYWPFFGVVGGCSVTFWDDDNKTIGHTLSRSGWRLHPCMAQAMERFPGHMALSDSRPDGFIMLSDRGCGTSLECDLLTGQIYRTGAGPDIPTEDGEYAGWMTTIQFMASSLEDCLNAMLEGTLYTRNRARGSISKQDFVSYIKSSCSADPRAVWHGLYRFSPGFFTLKEPDLEDWDVYESESDLLDA
jgi:hypothetical protein